MLGTSTIRTQTAILDWAEKAVSSVAAMIKRWSPKRRLNGAFTLARRKLLEHQSALLSQRESNPHAFYVKCFSGEATAFRIQLELVTDVPVFRTSLHIEPGWNEHYLDAAENDREVRLIFTWLDFVSLQQGLSSIPQLNGAAKRSTATQKQPGPARKIKCVAWDLDNTLWHGVIGDAGASGVTPNRDMIDLMQRLDERGILQTIVSKNHYDTAWP